MKICVGRFMGLELYSRFISLNFDFYDSYSYPPSELVHSPYEIDLIIDTLAR